MSEQDGTFGTQDTAPAAPPAPDPGQPVAPQPLGGGVRRGAVWWGVTLIIVGGLLLVSQLLPHMALWRYWPLIIVAVGVRQMFGPAAGHWSLKHAAEGLTTVAFGLIFLGQMLGYLGWDVWLNILRLWPLLLVALGLEIAGKGMRSESVRVLGSMVIIGGLAYGALVMTSTGSWVPFVPVNGTGTQFSSEAPHDRTVDEGVAVVRGGVGRFTLEAGGDLATADGRSPFEHEFEAETDNGVAEVTIGMGGGTSWGPVIDGSRMDVTLDRSVVWDLTVESGVTQYEVDLTDLAVERLSLDAGVSDGTLILGPADAADTGGPVPAEIEAGVSALTVRVPRGESVRIVVTEGLSGVDVQGDWSSSRDGNLRVYESEDFDSSGAYWDVTIRAGIGGITIEYY